MNTNILEASKLSKIKKMWYTQAQLELTTQQIFSEKKILFFANG